MNVSQFNLEQTLIDLFIVILFIICRTSILFIMFNLLCTISHELFNIYYVLWS